MKFQIVIRKKQKLMWDRDFNRMVSSITILFVMIILALILALFRANNIFILVPIFFIGAIYKYYSDNLFSYVNYYDAIGEIEFDKDMIIINDEAFGYDKIKQVKIFIGFYKNYAKGMYSHLWDGISRIEFYVGEKQHKYSFIIHSEEEYFKFEKLLINLQSGYTIQTMDNLRRDNLRLPVLSK
jgi:hypothetical protein